MKMLKATQLPSGRWRAQVYLGKDDKGSKKFKSFTADSEDEAIWLAMAYKKEHPTPETQEHYVTLREAFEQYIGSRNNILSPSTIRGYEIIMNNRFSAIMDKVCKDITITDIQSAVNADSIELSQKTIKSSFGLLKSVLSAQGIELNWKKITLPSKRKKVVTIPNVDEILSAVVGTEIELPCLLAMWCSMRISEIRGLQFKDISADGRTIHVQRVRMYLNGKDVVHDRTKTYESDRIIELPEYIYGLINKVPHTSDNDFIVYQGYNFIYKRYRALMRSRGYDTTFHKLRHCFATTLHELGIPENYIQKMGGWSTDIVMKAVYTHTIASKETEYGNIINDYFVNAITKRMT